MQLALSGLYHLVILGETTKHVTQTASSIWIFIFLFFFFGMEGRGLSPGTQRELFFVHLVLILFFYYFAHLHVVFLNYSKNGREAPLTASRLSFIDPSSILGQAPLVAEGEFQDNIDIFSICSLRTKIVHVYFKGTFIFFFSFGGVGGKAGGGVGGGGGDFLCYKTNPVWFRFSKFWYCLNRISCIFPS